MTHNERLGIAAHLHVLLRRKLGRVTDTEWMALDLAYAEEVLRVSRESADDEIHAWADRFEVAIQVLKPRAAPALERAARPPETASHSAVERRYVGRLR